MRRIFLNLTFFNATVLTSCLLPSILFARTFYSDDPLRKEPPPTSVGKIAARKVDPIWDFIENTFSRRGERTEDGKIIPAQNVNTLGEVPDSSWYTNRHSTNRMTIAELVRGAGNSNAPCKDGPWKIISAKLEGITPGFEFKDCKDRKYIIKFDPLSNPEMASGAEVVTTKFLYALGYNVPENYIVHFKREQLQIARDAEFRGPEGKRRHMSDKDMDELLERVPKDPQKGYRGMASRYIAGEVLGPFLFYGTRADDPNDIVPHQHRRELRGLHVLFAWLGQSDAKAPNTLDTVVEEDGVRFVRHYLIDFGASLGSATVAPKESRTGNQYMLDWIPHAVQTFTLGLHVPRWARARFPDIPAAGHFEWQTFDPDNWKPNYPNAAFKNRLPDDLFWAAKQVMAFTDEEIRAIVKTANYTDPEAEQWIAECLIARRDKIGKAFLTRVLPLDNFAVENGRLAFEHLAAKYDLAVPRSYVVRWSRFDNETGQKSTIEQETTVVLPKEVMDASPGEYFAADLHDGDPAKAVTVYLRKQQARVDVVGIDRTWSGFAPRAKEHAIAWTAPVGTDNCAAAVGEHR
ncbi:MAG: hypothetical protein HYX72_15395 [Acidobacteria bacterium]|nr:hypothetical protein [Acidobacteriota bacterium]